MYDHNSALFFDESIVCRYPLYPFPPLRSHQYSPLIIQNTPTQSIFDSAHFFWNDVNEKRNPYQNLIHSLPLFLNCSYGVSEIVSKLFSGFWGERGAGDDGKGVDHRVITFPFLSFLFFFYSGHSRTEYNGT